MTFAKPAKLALPEPVLDPEPARPRLRTLLRVSGGRRYAVALGVDALGAGLLRPFLLLYGIIVTDIPVTLTGILLSAGVLAGLLGVPFTGRWIDRGARTAPIVASLALRVLGVVLLLAAHGPVGFAAAAILLGLGNQSWNPAHAAVITTLVTGRNRDAALAASRSLRNAGLGAGALLATAAVAGGADALRALAGATALAYVVAAALVATMRLTAGPSLTAPRGTPNARHAVGMRALYAANLPYALCFDVLEVALPAVLVLQLHASAAWSAGIFVTNTLMVIAIQVPVVLWLSRYSRRTALVAAGLVLAASYGGFAAAGATGSSVAPMALAAVSVIYTFGEILYTGSGVALVAATAPPPQLGRALARWQISTGIGQAAAPAVITGLLSADPLLLWATLSASTLLSAAVISRRGPTDRREDGRLAGQPRRGQRDEGSMTAIGPTSAVAHSSPRSQQGRGTGPPPLVAPECSLRIPGTATSVGELPTRTHHGRVSPYGVTVLDAGSAGMLAAQVRASTDHPLDVLEADVT